MIVGTIVAEGLAAGATIDLPIVIRRIHRVRAASADGERGQPEVWTLLDFSCDLDRSDELATQLSSALAAGPWYADWLAGTARVVVFADRIFTVDRDDPAALAGVIEYGRQVGVPEAQLDWAV